MNFIKGDCFTNLDSYETTQWPYLFCSVPLINDRIMSLDRKKALRVCRITHCMSNNEPYVEIELTDWR